MRVTGRFRPNKPMSALTALVGVGMVIVLVLFAVNKDAGLVAFLALWVLAVLAIVGYHLANSLAHRGVAHSVVEFEADPPSAGADDFETKLRKLERLREDGLLSQAEYEQKREQIMREKW